MKKIITFSLISIISISFIFSSGKSEANENPLITLTWYQWFDAETQEKELTPIIEAFEAENPNIKIELSAISNENYWDRLALDIASGVEGDIVTLDTGAGINTYYNQRKNGAFIPLDDYIKDCVLDDGTNLETDIYQIDSIKRDGNIVAIPYLMFTAPMTAYNKAALEDAGIDPSELSTWNGYYKAANKLTQDIDGDGKIDIYGWGHPSYIETVSRWWHMHWLWTAGGGIFPNEEAPYTSDRLIFNSKENIEAVTFLKNMYDTTAPQGNKTVSDLHAMFENGSIATVQVAIWTLANFQAMMSAEQYEDGFGLVPFPSDGDKEPILVTWGNPLAISSNCEYPDEAFKFISFLLDKESQIKAMRRAAPVNKLVYEEYEKEYPKQATFIKDTQEFTMRNVPDIPQWNEFDHIIQISISDALLGSKTVKEALDWGQSEMIKALD